MKVIIIRSSPYKCLHHSTLLIFNGFSTVFFLRRQKAFFFLVNNKYKYSYIYLMKEIHIPFHKYANTFDHDSIRVLCLLSKFFVCFWKHWMTVRSNHIDIKWNFGFVWNIFIYSNPIILLCVNIKKVILCTNEMMWETTLTPFQKKKCNKIFSIEIKGSILLAIWSVFFIAAHLIVA